MLAGTNETEVGVKLSGSIKYEALSACDCVIDNSTMMKTSYTTNSLVEENFRTPWEETSNVCQK